MKFSSFKYLFKQGWSNFKGNRLMSVASVGVVTSCLFLVGLCGSLVLNVNSFVQYLGAQNEVVIYMKDEATLDNINTINTSLENDEDVASFSYVSKEEALKEQRERSQTASKGMFKGGLEDHGEQTIKYHTACHLLLAALQGASVRPYTSGTCIL